MDALGCNSRLQACVAVAVRQQAQRRQNTPPVPTAPSKRRGLHGLTLGLLLVAACLFGWRSAQPLLAVEPPPSTLQLTNVHETHVPFPRLHARVTNTSGRAVGRAVWTIRYPETSPPLEEQLVVQDLEPGETREVLAPFLGAAPPTHRMTQRQVLPLSVEWRS